MCTVTLVITLRMVDLHDSISIEQVCISRGNLYKDIGHDNFKDTLKIE